MPDAAILPSLNIIAERVAVERAVMDGHAESLDTKAGVVLGFAGVLVGLGATAQTSISSGWVFRSGLIGGVAAGVVAVWAFMPRRYPVMEVLELRRQYLTAPEHLTRLDLLDTQIEMVRQTGVLLKTKGRRLRLALVLLAASAAVVMVGTLLGN